MLEEEEVEEGEEEDGSMSLTYLPSHSLGSSISVRATVHCMRPRSNVRRVHVNLGMNVDDAEGEEDDGDEAVRGKTAVAA